MGHGHIMDLGHVCNGLSLCKCYFLFISLVVHIGLRGGYLQLSSLYSSLTLFGMNIDLSIHHKKTPRV
jgi:inner membrane protein involved in colicin E2 resistance